MNTPLQWHCTLPYYVILCNTKPYHIRIQNRNMTTPLHHTIPYHTMKCLTVPIQYHNVPSQHDRPLHHAMPSYTTAYAPHHRRRAYFATKQRQNLRTENIVEELRQRISQNRNMYFSFCLSVVHQFFLSVTLKRPYMIMS